MARIRLPSGKQFLVYFDNKAFREVLARIEPDLPKELDIRVTVCSEIPGLIILQGLVNKLVHFIRPAEPRERMYWLFAVTSPWFFGGPATYHIFLFLDPLKDFANSEDELRMRCAQELTHEVYHAVAMHRLIPRTIRYVLGMQIPLHAAAQIAWVLQGRVRPPLKSLFSMIGYGYTLSALAAGAVNNYLTWREKIESRAHKYAQEQISSPTNGPLWESTFRIKEL